MTDEDSDGVPRRNALALIGGTTVATGVSALSIKYIVDNVLTPNDAGTGGNQGGSGNQGSNGGDSRDNYDDWTTEVPSGCELPESYADDVETYIDDNGMDSSRMNEYVESGRVAFERDGTELGLLVDQDNDGQYDTSGNFEDLCG